MYMKMCNSYLEFGIQWTVVATSCKIGKIGVFYLKNLVYFENEGRI